MRKRIVHEGSRRGTKKKEVMQDAAVLPRSGRPAGALSVVPIAIDYRFCRATITDSIEVRLTMPQNTLEYSRLERPTNSGWASVSRYASWISLLFGLLAVGLLPMIPAAEYSIVGGIAAAFSWILSLPCLAAAITALILRRASRLGWIGLLLGLIAFLSSGAFMMFPPNRKDF